MHPKHPSSQFDVGNRLIFGSVGESLYDELRKFHKTHYVGSNIKVVLYSSLSLLELERIAIKAFSTIPRGEKNKQHENHLVWQKLGNNVVEIKSNGSTKSLDIMFPFPSKYYGEDDGTLVFLLNYLGAETRGSLFNRLSEIGYITSLNVNMIGDAHFGILDLYFKLTPLGVKHINQIIMELHSYVGVLSLSKEANRYYEELEYKSKIESLVAAKSEPGDWISDINERMFRLSKTAWIDPSTLFADEGLNKTSLDRFVDFLSRDTMLIVKADSDTQNATIVSTFYRLPYKLSSISLDNAKYSSDSHYQIPSRNPFIELENRKEKPNPNINQKLIQLKEGGVNVWIDNREHYASPSAHAMVFINQPNLPKNMQNFVNRLIHSRELQFKLSDFTHFAKQAGYAFRIEAGQNGYVLSIAGEPEAFEMILAAVFREMSAEETIKRDFSIAVEESKSSINRVLQEQLQRRVRAAVSSNIHNGYIIEKRALLYLNDIEMSDYEKWKRQTRQSQTIDAVFTGNFDQKRLFTQFKNWVPTNVFKKQILQKKISNKVLKSDYEDGYVSLGIDLSKDVGFLYLLDSFMSQAFFQTIRTNQEIGYFVDSSVVKSNGKAFLVLSVQSDKHTAEFLESEILRFLTEYKKQIAQLTSDEYKGQVASLIAAIKTPSPSIVNYAKSNVDELLYKSPSEKEQIQRIEEIDQHEFIACYDEMISTLSENSFTIRIN
ncbi:insulinase family protein [Pseudoalteromonas piscicida]|uniref:insulinase family protein n=1 Tax=Pseudoalteromonas piscicida TaxID=43662 RepID=UPI0030A40023